MGSSFQGLMRYYYLAMEAAEKWRQSAPRARQSIGFSLVGTSHGFVAAARSDCFASSEASQKIRPSSIARTMPHKHTIFMRHWVRRRRVRDCFEDKAVESLSW